MQLQSVKIFNPISILAIAPETCPARETFGVFSVLSSMILVVVVQAFKVVAVVVPDVVPVDEVVVVVPVVVFPVVPVVVIIVVVPIVAIPVVLVVIIPVQAIYQPT